jgi:lipopolysaccharide transport system ATP-binding protein
MPGDTVISVEGLSKRYRLGYVARHDTLRDALSHGLKNLSRLLRGSGRAASAGNSEFWALRDVTFEVKRGEAVGIIGRNGAGKSTLLKILSRITEPTTGRVTLQGRVASLLEVGTGFHPELSGRENILLNGAILGMSRTEIRRKFDEIVAFAEVEKFLDTPVKHYSSGMYVRLAFAVAAQLEPEILIVDEVLAVGDAQFQKKCLGKMESVAQTEGRTVLFVSHNMAAVRSLCSRTVYLDRGRIVAIGSTADVLTRYIAQSAEINRSGALTPDMHAGKPTTLWFDRVTLQNRSGQRISQLQLREPAVLILSFRALKPVRQVRVGLGFATLEGTRIATLHHTDNGAEAIDLAPGTYEMTIQLENPLLPGSYMLTVGAHQSLAGTTLDYMPEALRFNVAAIGYGDVKYNDINPGLVHVNAVWQLPKTLNDTHA